MIFAHYPTVASKLQRRVVVVLEDFGLYQLVVKGPGCRQSARVLDQGGDYALDQLQHSGQDQSREDGEVGTTVLLSSQQLFHRAQFPLVDNVWLNYDNLCWFAASKTPYQGCRSHYPSMCIRSLHKNGCGERKQSRRFYGLLEDRR